MNTDKRVKKRRVKKTVNKKRENIDSMLSENFAVNISFLKIFFYSP